METNKLLYQKKIDTLLKSHNPKTIILKDPSCNKVDIIENPGMTLTEEIYLRIQQFVDNMKFPQVIQLEKVINNVIHIEYINKVNTA